MPVAGQIVGGRYRLIRPLGEGGMASVWAAEHKTMGNIVAVKIISPDLLKFDLAIARFNREARAAAKLRSPFVVQLFDHDVDPELGPYIAMELLEGESLADRLERELTLAPPDLGRIMLQVGKGLMRAHAAGIVHRDLKPDNIFLSVDEDGEETAKILDFGVAKADSPLGVRESNKTVAGALVGTLNYMSPEQAQGHEVNHLTDLWALGVIAFEALVGRRPFEEEAVGAVVMQICAHPMPVPSALNPGVPPGFDAWFAHACNRDPAKRFQSAQDLARALARECDADELSIDDVVDPSSPGMDPGAGPALRRKSVPQRPSEQQPQGPAAPNSDAIVEPAARSLGGRGSGLELGLSDLVAEETRESSSKRDSQDQKPSSDKTANTPDASSEPSGKRRVLQLVDSTAPPPPLESMPPLALNRPSDRNSLDLEVEFDLDPEYYVSHGVTTVGPVTLDTLRTSYLAGYVLTDSLIWTAEWASWRRASEVFSLSLQRPRQRPAPNLALVGTPCALPKGAPPRPTRPVPVSIPATPTSAVRETPGRVRSREPVYYLGDGALIVGPVRASLLRSGLEQSRIPPSAVVWREGWSEWKPSDSVAPELEAWPPAAIGLLRNRPGIEAVGMKTHVPPGAPPVLARDRSGQSK